MNPMMGANKKRDMCTQAVAYDKTGTHINVEMHSGTCRVFV